MSLAVGAAACSDDSWAAEPVDFIQLGTIDGAAINPLTSRLGTPEYDDLRGQIEHAADLAPEERAALGREPEAGHELLLFVLIGCREDTAELVVTASEIAASLVSDEEWHCAVPEYYLATFDVPAEKLVTDRLLKREPVDPASAR